MSKANNKSELTQIAYLGGENAGGLAKVAGIKISEAFVLAKI